MERATETKTKLTLHRLSIMFVVGTAAVTIVFAVLALIIRQLV